MFFVVSLLISEIARSKVKSWGKFRSTIDGDSITLSAYSSNFFETSSDFKNFVFLMRKIIVVSGKLMYFSPSLVSVSKFNIAFSAAALNSDESSSFF